MHRLGTKLRLYARLIKGPQTALLVITGLAGYGTARCPVFSLPTLLGLTVSLLASISGSTILNMWWDRDIDACMARTRSRPLADGRVAPGEALAVGLALTAAGVGLGLALNPLFGAILIAGAFFDVVIYTLWLKRRTCWSIVWGGVSGAMPVLAGRALGLGGLDAVGAALALGVLFWIPTHILTFSTRHAADYHAAGIPTFVSRYGAGVTRAALALSSLLAALAMGAAAWGIGLEWGFLRLLAVLSLGLIFLAVMLLAYPSERVNFGLFKYASVYMLSSMLLMAL